MHIDSELLSKLSRIITDSIRAENHAFIRQNFCDGLKVKADLSSPENREQINDFFKSLGRNLDWFKPKLKKFNKAELDQLINTRHIAENPKTEEFIILSPLRKHINAQIDIFVKKSKGGKRL